MPYIDQLARRRVRSTVQALQYRSAISAVRRYALFVGYPRTGHTLVAALLDAHPNMLFANGLDVARYVEAGFDFRRLAALSIWNSLRFTRHGRRSNGYSYAVPGGWHGRWHSLHVVGDKSGDLFSEHLASTPALADRTLALFGDRLRVIHVLRNPFDVIATMARRAGSTLDDAAAQFLTLCEANRAVRSKVPAAMWLDLRLERLIERPQEALEKLCGFLGERASPEYVESCRRLLFDAPRRSRGGADWDASLVERLESRLRAYAWFDGYSFRGG